MNYSSRLFVDLPVCTEGVLLIFRCLTLNREFLSMPHLPPSQRVMIVGDGNRSALAVLVGLN